MFVITGLWLISVLSQSITSNECPHYARKSSLSRNNSYVLFLLLSVYRFWYKPHLISEDALNAALIFSNTSLCKVLFLLCQDIPVIFHTLGCILNILVLSFLEWKVSHSQILIFLCCVRPINSRLSLSIQRVVLTLEFE